jgi:hypothetical protein
MALVDLTELVREALEEHGQMRLSELREEVGFDDVAKSLIQLAENGEVAILPIGEVVVILPEE